MIERARKMTLPLHSTPNIQVRVSRRAGGAPGGAPPSWYSGRPSALYPRPSTTAATPSSSTARIVRIGDTSRKGNLCTQEPLPTFSVMVTFDDHPVLFKQIPNAAIQRLLLFALWNSVGHDEATSFWKLSDLDA